MSARKEVAVIGAGFAGLAAARALAERGVAVAVFEARNHLGGRAMTVQHEGDALPVELGPEYVHDRPEATLALLREAGIARTAVDDVHHMLRGGRLVEMPDVWDRFADLLRGARHDESARAFLARRELSPDDAALFAMFVEGFYAAPLGDIGIASVAADASGGAEADEQTRVVGGYGPLAAWLEARLARLGVPVHRACVVRAIDWRGDPIVLDLEGRGTAPSATASRAIVTVPIGVLRALDGDALRFTPALDGPHAAALGAIAMGQAVKIVVCLRTPVWREREPHDLSFVHARGGAFPTFWVRSAGDTHQLTAWAGGPHARALAGCNEAARVELALAGFADALGMPRAELADAVRDHHTHDYAADPFALGAYSYTRVGGTGAAEALARPLGGKLWLAGEATDAAYEGTVGGALASGLRAAREVLAILDARRESAARP